MFSVELQKYRKSFIPSTIEMWNELDIDTRNTEDINVFKPKIMPNRRNVLYCYGQRSINIIHAQIRMSSSNLKSHLKSLHVIDDAICMCVAMVLKIVSIISLSVHYIMLKDKPYLQPLMFIVL